MSFTLLRCNRVLGHLRVVNYILLSSFSVCQAVREEGVRNMVAHCLQHRKRDMTVLLLCITVAASSIEEKTAKERVWMEKWLRSSHCLDKKRVWHG